MRFEDTNLIPELLQAVSDAGYEAPTRIQEDTIPLALMGRDVLGCAQTGTGKTAAFALPILQRLYLGEKALYGGRTAGSAEEPVPVQFARTMDEAYGRTGEDSPKEAAKGRGKKKGNSAKEDGADGRTIRALILTPTRELALQIGESFELYGKHLPLRTTVVFGGVSQVPQTDQLKRGVDILVATPGRLNDLIGQGYISLDHLETFVLDEADRMLDMGFIHDVRRIMTKLPPVRQTLLFSATMPMEVEKLALDLLYQPITVKVNPPTSTVDAIHQTVYFVDKVNKRKLLLDLLKDPAVESALVFVRTKHGADRVSRDLVRGGVSAKSIHGDKSQGARQEALAQFKAGRIRALVATDIAARGIDIFGLSHVFNYDVPNEPETYIHRIGRTGRAGLTGEAVTFCCYDELEMFRAVEKLIGMNIEDVPSPYPMEVFASSGERIGRPPVGAEKKSSGNRNGSRRGGRGERDDNVKKYGRDRKERDRRFPKEEWFDPETEDVVETVQGSSFDEMAGAAAIGAAAVAAAAGEGAPKKKRRRRRKKKTTELNPSAETAGTAVKSAEERPEALQPKQPKNEPAGRTAEGKP
ncbi:MAG: DEAD/DEAH box helicase, partial [Firmicutes bacterium]|nr:DEAD/DEAH box helicase [Bacillota bacterium]